MTMLRLSGYVMFIDDSKLTLNGDNTTSWTHLGASYWSPGICRHVSKDKRECTIKTTPETIYEKNGQECKRADLAGCFANVNVRIKKYKFYPIGVSKVATSGWQIIAVSVKQKSPLIFDT